MIRIAEAAMSSDRYLPLDEALAGLRTSVRPTGNGGSHDVTLAGMSDVWRAMLDAYRWRYPDLPSAGEDRMPLAAWERVLERLTLDLTMGMHFATRAALVEQGPTPEDLNAAPFLAVWMPVVEPPDGPLLCGRVEGHPHLGNRWITTSLVIGLDAAAGWSRTWSRWYRVGQRLMHDEISAVRGRELRPGIQSIEDAGLAEHLSLVRQQVGSLLQPLERGR